MKSAEKMNSRDLLRSKANLPITNSMTYGSKIIDHSAVEWLGWLFGNRPDYQSNLQCLKDDGIEDTEHFLPQYHAYDYHRHDLLGTFNEVFQLLNILTCQIKSLCK